MICMIVWISYSNGYCYFCVTIITSSYTMVWLSLVSINCMPIMDPKHMISPCLPVNGVLIMYTLCHHWLETIQILGGTKPAVYNSLSLQSILGTQNCNSQAISPSLPPSTLISTAAWEAMHECRQG